MVQDNAVAAASVTIAPRILRRCALFMETLPLDHPILPDKVREYHGQTLFRRRSCATRECAALSKPEPSMRAVPGEVHSRERRCEQEPRQRILQMVVGNIDARLLATRPCRATPYNGFEDNGCEKPEMFAIRHSL